MTPVGVGGKNKYKKTDSDIAAACRAAACIPNFWGETDQAAVLVYHSQGLRAINIHLVALLEPHCKVNGLGQSMLVIARRR